MNKRNSSKNVNTNPNHNRYTHQQTPSTSPDYASTSQQFTIEQKLPTNKKGSNNLKSKDPKNEIIIPRRFGEGIKPIFNREDVQVNSYLQSSDSRRSVSISSAKRSERRISSSSSCSSSSNSPQRYRPRSRRHEKSLSPKRKKTPDKVPYFVDTKREQDRLRSKVEVSRSKSEHKHTTTSESRRRTRSRSRSHERSRRRRSSSREKYKSTSHSRHRRHSHDRDRSHSRDRDRYYRSSRMPVETQYIPVPVPMDYSTFGPRWIQPMLPFPYPRYPVIRPPPNFPIPPFFQPRMRAQRFPRPQRERTYQARYH